MKLSMPGSTRRRWLGSVAALAPCLALVAACTTSHSTTTGHTVIHGGTATFAEEPGAPPNYIFPLTSPAYFSTNNVEQFQDLMYRPLYWFGSQTGGYPVLDEALSLAYAPVFSHDNTVVTIKLKPYRWSDGQPVTSRDVVFWMNLIKANKTNWGAYVPGQFPDNVTRVQAKGPNVVVLTLSRSFNQTWFTYNQMDQIVPLPQQLWDKTSVSGKVGNYDETPRGAVAVYNFLAGQSKSPSTYSANPLWRVVDGPWKLQSLTPTGEATFVPNADYSGPVKPKLSKFIELPFTSLDAELAVLRSGGLTYGYVPTTALAQRQALAASGYVFAPWQVFGIGYIVINFNNPAVGPILKQLYVRQAMEMLVDQPAIVKHLLDGYGTPTYGPVPATPKNPYTTPSVLAGPLPFDPAKAMAMLQAHGWAHRSGGDVCTRPGSGSGQCGPGVKMGAQLRFNLQYASGITYLNQEMVVLQSQFAKAGIDLALSEAPFSDVFGTAVPCQPQQSACKWQLEDWGISWIYTGEDNYPSGEELFQTGAATNAGNYSDPVNDANIKRTLTVQGTAPMVPYQEYLATHLPVIWMPLAPYQLSEINGTLKGALPQDPVNNIYPEDWYFVK